MRIPAAWTALACGILAVGCAGRGYQTPYDGGSWSTSYGGDSESYAQDYTGYVKAEQSETRTRSSAQTRTIEASPSATATLLAETAPVAGTVFSAEREWEPGVAAERRGDCNGALRRFSALERKGLPRTAAAARAIGRCHMRRGENEKAASAFASAMKDERFRGDVEMHRMLTAAHLRAGRRDLAEGAALAGLELFPGDPTLLGQLARCRKAVKEEFKDAAKEAKEVKGEAEEEAKEKKEETEEAEKKVREEAGVEERAAEKETKEESKEVREEAGEEKGEVGEENKDVKEEAEATKKEAKDGAKAAKEKSKEARKKAEEEAKALEKD